MKARIPQTKAGIWLYRPTEESAAAVSAAAAEVGAELHRFGEEAAGSTVAELLSGRAAAAEHAPEESVLLMDGLERKELDVFLAALRRQCAAYGAAPIALKAVVTPTNRGWKFADLAQELKKEDAMLHEK